MKNFGYFSRLLLLFLALVIGFALVTVYIPNRSPDDSMGKGILVFLCIIAAVMIWSASCVLAIVSIIQREKGTALTLTLNLVGLATALSGFFVAIEVSAR